MRVEPPTITTPLTSCTVSLASRSALRTALRVRAVSVLVADSKSEHFTSIMTLALVSIASNATQSVADKHSLQFLATALRVALSTGLALSMDPDPVFASTQSANAWS